MQQEIISKLLQRHINNTYFNDNKNVLETFTFG